MMWVGVGGSHSKRKVANTAGRVCGISRPNRFFNTSIKRVIMSDNVQGEVPDTIPDKLGNLIRLSNVYQVLICIP